MFEKLLLSLTKGKGAGMTCFIMEMLDIVHNYKLFLSLSNEHK